MKKLLSLFTALPLVAILMFSPLVFAGTGDIVIEGKYVEVPSNGMFYSASYFPDYNEADQGVTGNGKSAKAYIDTISTDSATLIFRHNSGAATTTYTFSTNETIPSNIDIIVEKGAILSIAAAQTLAINGPFDAGLYQVFSLTGTGKGDLSSALVKKVPPQWWGVTGDASDETIELQAWLNCGAKSLYLPKPPTAYGHTGLIVPASTSNLYIVGENYSDVELRYLSAAGNGITFAGEADNFYMENVDLSSPSSSSGWAIYSNQISGSPIRDLIIRNCELSEFLKGINIQGGLNLRIEGGRISGQGQAVAGGIGIQIGEDAAHACNHAVIDQVYLSSFETNTYIKYASPVSIINPISEHYVTGLKLDNNASIVMLTNAYFYSATGTNDVLMTGGYVFDFSPKAPSKPSSVTNRYISYSNYTKLPVRAYSAGAQNIATATVTQVVLATETYDSENQFASNTYTCTVPGFHNVKASVLWDGRDPGLYVAHIYKNAGVITTNTRRLNSTTEAPFSLVLNDVIWLDNGDTIKIYVEQDTGGAESVTGGSTNTFLVVHGI